MVQQFRISGEDKREALSKKCLNEAALRAMLGKCPPEDEKCGPLSRMQHKMFDTKARDFLPAGKLCKSTGSKGVLLLESERDEYEKTYCKIDPLHKICKKHEEEEEEEEDEEEETEPTEAKGQAMASTEVKKSSPDGIMGGILLSSSSCCCLLIIIGGGVVMMKRR
jgi:hypothetical protein